MLKGVETPLRTFLIDSIEPKAALTVISYTPLLTTDDAAGA